MWYGIYETILNVKNTLITRMFYPKARLLRFPLYMRNRKGIKWEEGLTSGYNCRMECVSISADKCGQISFGKNVKIGDNVHIASASKVEIGDNVLMASHIFISDLDHGMYAGENQTSPKVAPDVREIHAEPIKIGNNVWLGENVVVLKGVTIGEGCIIGANALVNKNIPDNSIAVGAPAKVIKKFNFKNNTWEKVNE